MDRQQVDNILNDINIAVLCADFLKDLVLDQPPRRIRESVSGLRCRPLKDGFRQSRLASNKLGPRLLDLRSLFRSDFRLEAPRKSLSETAVRARHGCLDKHSEIFEMSDLYRQ